MDLKPPIFKEGLEGRLWGISGYFLQADKSSIPFGGYFFEDNLMSGKVLQGELIDLFGHSIIENGKFIPDLEISFDKAYSNGTYHYQFKKQGDLFIGSYTSSKISEQAACKIFCLSEK